MVSAIRVLFSCYVGFRQIYYAKLRATPIRKHDHLKIVQTLVKYRETNDQKTSFSAYYFFNDWVRWL